MSAPADWWCLGMNCPHLIQLNGASGYGLAMGWKGSANGLASWLACADGDQPRRVDAGWINLVRRQMNGNVRGCPVSQGGLCGGGELGTRVNFGPANDGT